MCRFVFAAVLSTSLLAIFVNAQSSTPDFKQPDAYAVVIGISKYREEAIPKVAYAVKDAEAMAKMLEVRAGVPRTHIRLMTDNNATGNDLRNMAEWLRIRINSGTSVYIYYAGHGTPDPKTGDAYLVPWDGQPDIPSSLYPLKVLYESLNKLPAQHIVVMLDTCFSGAAGRSVLAKGARPMALSLENPLLGGGKIVVLAAAAGNQIASEDDENEHGLFTFALLNGLWSQGYIDEAHRYVLSLQKLYAYVRKEVSEVAVQRLNREQTPVMLPAEADQVQFMATNPWPEAPDREVISDLTFRAGSRKAVERAFKEMEKKVHEVQARKSYRWPKGASQEIVGKDGAPMVLVPEGEFVYDLGFGAKIVALPAFYIDKFEVTTKRYAAFRQAAGRAEPEFWNQVIFDRDGDRPVIGISWHDADAYCRYYGKWLPTEEEWEKAARGTDGRVYPWGYEQPTIRHANFNKPVDWERKGYATLSPVGSYEEGKSPYGAYDMAGNVWEWTSSDDLKDRAEPRKWIRGGGWNNTSALPLETTWRLSEVPEFGGKTVGFRCAQGVR